MGWLPGNRVRVFLPDHTRRVGSGCRSGWFTGTVRSVDPPGLRAGVLVDLDLPVNGLSDCFATHAELEPATDTASLPNRKDCNE